MKNDEEKLIKLIININEVKEAEFNSIDNQVDISYIISFSEFLNKEFSVENLTEEILIEINKIDTDIFTNEKYLYDFYKNNKIRKIIAEYKNKHNKNSEKLLFDKEMVKKYLKESYLLINYVSLKKEDVLNYIKINEKVLYLLNSNFIDKEILLKSLKINKRVALILDEVDKENYFPIKNYYLKTKRNDFLKDKEIYDEYINDIIELLKEDISLYINLSKEAKNDNKIKEVVSKIDKKYLAFNN